MRFYGTNNLDKLYHNTPFSLDAFGYYPYHAARADLLRRMNQREAAAEAYERALALCGNYAERAYLQRRFDEMLSRFSAARID